MIEQLFKKAYLNIHDKIYNYRTIKKEPSEWIEENIYFTSDVSRYTGFFKYKVSPYSREVVDCLSPNSPVEMVAVMKCAQSGFSMGVIIPGIWYLISENPSNIMYLAGDKELARDSIRTRFDPIGVNSGLHELIRPNVIKKKNQRTGDTDFSKEFAGGSLIVNGVNNPDKLRQYSVKVVFADDFDAAPRSDKKEGDMSALIENRTKSFGTMKKIFYISTPTIKNQSNIEEKYELGDKRLYHWNCPHCKNYIPMEWRTKREDGTFAGIKWELDKNNELIPESVHYECQECGGKILEKDKVKLNLTGKWIPTAKPFKPNYRSYKLNALVIPPGFDSWVDLVYQWLQANPPNEPINEDKLKVFLNTQLGETWEEKGSAPKVTELMSNTRSYHINVVPDETIEQDGNGKVALITLACDLGGIMNDQVQDVRLDWEIVAHSTKGVSYSINHGSIGTFKRGRKKSKSEKEDDTSRTKWTYEIGMPNNVWDELTKIIEKTLGSQSGKGYDIDMTVIDTGHFTRLAYRYIGSQNNPLIIGIKGYAEDDYRRLSKDTPIIKPSIEMKDKLYILQVNQLKDILATNMRLRVGMDGYQPTGFMNFPMPENRKYTYKDYFLHYEGEHRVPEIKNGQEVGYSWKKKNTSVENHFFDVGVYTIASKYIYIDIIRRRSTKFARLTWESWCTLVENKKE